MTITTLPPIGEEHDLLVPDRCPAPPDEPTSPSWPPPTPPPRHRSGWRPVAAAAAVALVVGGGAGWTVAHTTARSAGKVTSLVAGGSPDIPAVIASVQPAVVTIDTTATGTTRRGQTVTSEAAGTGIIIDANGLIATNAHVVEGATTVTITLSDGSTADGTVVGTDTAADLAVIRIARSGLTAATLGSSASLRVGDTVVAIGNALALQGSTTATLGIVSALHRSITTSSGTTYADLLQTDAPINPGDSGGPLVSTDGRVVGINTAGTTTAENIGFAIPIDVAAPVLARLAAAA